MRLIIVLFITVNSSNFFAQKDWDFGVMTSFGLGYRVFQSEVAGLEKIRKSNDHPSFNYSLGLSVQKDFGKQNAFVIVSRFGRQGFTSNNQKSPNSFYMFSGESLKTINYSFKFFFTDVLYKRNFDRIPTEPWCGIGLSGSFFLTRGYQEVSEAFAKIRRPNLATMLSISWDLDIIKRNKPIEIGAYGYIDFFSNEDTNPIRDQAKIWFTGFSAYVKYYF